MLNSRHREAILSPSLSRITNRIRSSITEHFLHGMFYILPPARQNVLPMSPERSVTYVSGRSVFENAPPLQPRFLDALSATAALNYMAGRERLSDQARAQGQLRVKKEVEFERAFVQAGGLLMAGCDPTGNGSALADFGDQRNIELLVEGGFTPLEAIRIATLNGAKFLGLDDKIGSIAAGKQAD